MSTQYSRIAIITGATSGIGEATARKLIANGYGVVGNGRKAEKLRTLEEEFNGAFCGVAGDASENSVLESLFTSAIAHFGKAADIVIANAGRGLGGSLKEADLGQLEEMFKVNVTGTLHLLQKAARKMTDGVQSDFPKRASDIVIIGSVVGRNISPFGAVYSASKFAVHALTESLRRELGPKGIRVSLVEPGVVISGFQEAAGYGSDLVRHFDEKFGPLLKGDDVGNAIHYIVSQPPHVHISDIVIRPTRQDYP